MTKNPKVSIIIPVYNGANYMKHAINSAINQTYKNIEILVVNDGSNDKGETEKIALSYGEKIRYFQKENGGVSSALNLALKEMKGTFFSWLSHDDIYYPDKIEKQINYLHENNLIDNKTILYGDYDIINKNGIHVSQSIKNHSMLKSKLEYALLRGSINGITLLIPKSAFEEHGFFEENLMCTQDYVMWHKMMKSFKFIHMPLILAKSRVHKKQGTISNPMVITEGNKLWVTLIESISFNNKIKLENSEYNYYYEMAKFLKNTNYQKAYNFCVNKYNEIRKENQKILEKIKVTVILLEDNKEKHIIESIKLILNQTHRNIELLVVTNKPAESLIMMKKLSNIDNRIKIVHTVKKHKNFYLNSEIIDNLNGEYIIFANPDILYNKEKIKYQLEYTSLFNADFSYIVKKEVSNKKSIIEEEVYFVEDIIPKCISNLNVDPTAIMVKTKCLGKLIRYNENNPIEINECFYLELLKHTQLLCIKKETLFIDKNHKCVELSEAEKIATYKTIIIYLLNSKKYNKYDYEIALFCNRFFQLVTNIETNNINLSNVFCPNCKKSNKSFLRKLNSPGRIISKVIKSVKENGIIQTVHKIKYVLTLR